MNIYNARFTALIFAALLTNSQVTLTATTDSSKIRLIPTIETPVKTNLSNDVLYKGSRLLGITSALADTADWLPHCLDGFASDDISIRGMLNISTWMLKAAQYYTEIREYSPHITRFLLGTQLAISGSSQLYWVYGTLTHNYGRLSRVARTAQALGSILMALHLYKKVIDNKEKTVQEETILV